MDWKLSAIIPMTGPTFGGLVRTKSEDRDMDAIKAAIKQGHRLWAMLDRHLEGRKFIAGDDLSIGDIPLGPQAFRWFELAEDRPSMPNLEAWYQRLIKRPAFRKNCMNRVNGTVLSGEVCSTRFE